MKRCRITVQINGSYRQEIDKLVYDHKVRSVSGLVRMALEEFLSKESDKTKAEDYESETGGKIE
ncbi:ribbon-helix-helix domain-containing protein [Candidatus Bathyarchaeota archaeon]|nr:ribbon-helix-helix domain-containing protein [Candidatus Bathyarchaeota archaeon]